MESQPSFYSETVSVSITVQTQVISYCQMIFHLFSHQFTVKGNHTVLKQVPSSWFRVRLVRAICSASYSGQTGRLVSLSVMEHKCHVRLRQTEKSAIAEHCLAKGHQAQFVDTRVLFISHSWYMRMTRESLKIALTDPGSGGVGSFEYYVAPALQ